MDTEPADPSRGPQKYDSRVTTQVRVLHVLNSLTASGVEMTLLNSAPLWRRFQIQNDVLATDKNIGSHARGFADAGFGVHQVVMNTEVSYLRDLRALRDGFAYVVGLWKLLKRHQYDVIHIHNERGFFYTAMVGRLAGARVVRSISSVFHFEGWPRLWRKGQRKLATWLGMRSVAISASVRDNERYRFGNEADVIYYGINPEVFRVASPEERQAAREELQVDQDDFLIVSIGNCQKIKNHELILQALSLLPTSIEWLYLHAGEGEEEPYERSLAAELALEQRCRFLGRTNDVTRLLHAADVFVMPSAYEGLGVAALESLCTGTTTVLTDAPGLRDISPSPGVIWTNPNPRELAGALRTARERPPSVLHRHRVSRDINERFSLGRMVESYAELYGVRDRARMSSDL